MKTPRFTWRKSSFSAEPQNNCVEVMDLAGPDCGRAVRDSKDPDGPKLRFTEPEWIAFIAGVKAGEFD